MIRPRNAMLCLCFLSAFAFALLSNGLCASLPDGFVYVEELIPDVKVELRYYSDHNFIGKRIDGYLAPRCILSRQAAEALKNVQADLKPFGLGLKIFDAYRPQQA
ncbi:MAG: M15 family metallopeptidase, partial [Acidobacteriota bacterium]